MLNIDIVTHDGFQCGVNSHNTLLPVQSLHVRNITKDDLLSSAFVDGVGEYVIPSQKCASILL